MPYYAATGGDTAVLLAGIAFIVFTIIISILLINSKCKNKKIQNIFYLMLVIQLVIVIIDNYIKAFPLINIDAKAFEGLGWFSYETNTNIGRGAYNTFIINPIYKLLKIRVAVIFGLMNIIFNVLTNLNIYETLKKLKINSKINFILLIISTLSPISLIYRSGVLREAIIIMFVSYSVKCFINFIVDKNSAEIIKAFIFIGLGAIFHSGVIFIVGGYLIALLDGRKNQKIHQFFIIILIIIIFIIFKDKLLEKVGGGDIERIIMANNYTSLKQSGSGYLKNITTTSLAQIIMYLPLFIFYFLYSPTPDMIRGIIDIISFALNSSIYIYLTIYGYYLYRKIKRRLSKKERMIIKCLFISAFFTVAVFSIGTRNAGTALRHRDKLVPILIIIFGIIQNRYFKYYGLGRRK